MKLFVLSICFVLFSFIYEARSTELSEVIKKALSANHQLKSANFALKAAEQDKYQALSTMMPNASMVLSLDAKRGMNQPNSQFQINQQLFNFGSSYFSLEKTKHSFLMHQSSFNLTKQRIVMHAINAFMQLLKAKEITKLRQKTLSVMEQHLQIANKKFQLGEITKADVAQVKSRLSSAHSDLVRASGDEKILIASYRHIIGEDPSQNLNYPKQLPLLPKTLNDAINEAKKHNNALKVARHGSEVAHYSNKEAATRLLPSVSLSMSWLQGNNLSAIPQQQKSNASLNVSIPIFQGGSEYAAIASSKYRFYGSLQDYYEAMKTLEESVITGWLNCESAKFLITASLDTVSAYETAVESIKREVELNIKSFIDLLDTELALLSSRINLIDAKSSYVISSYNLALHTSDIDTLLQ